MGGGIHTLYSISEFKIFFILALAFVFSFPIKNLIEKCKFNYIITDIACISILCVSMIVMSSSAYNPFIYFRF